MLRSIRWRLQLWHALVLLGVVALFGVILFGQERQARWQEVDAELQACARVLEGSLRGAPPHVIESLFPDREHRPPRSPRPSELSAEGPPPEDRRPPKKGPPKGSERKGPPEDRHNESERLDGLFSLPRHLAYRYSADRLPYYVIRDAEDRVVRSTAASDVPAWDDVRLESDSDFVARQRGPFREILIRAPHHSTILVGRDVSSELNDLARQAGWIALIGSVMWVLGVLGGLLLSHGVLLPIERMSSAASEIAAADFSRRLEPEETVRELAELARVLNSAFDRLQGALAQQVRFTADASHELRTPLAVILSQCELALAQTRSPEEYQETVAACHRAAERMHRLVESLLQLARLDSGEGSLNCQPCDLSEVARECLEMVEPLAEFRDISIRGEFHAARILADRERLAQVLTNLLANAVNYNRSGGSIVLRVERDASDAVLTVADTGVGMAAKHLPHIFERFYRADPSRSREQGGSGLGLAISQQIIHAHGGTIQAASVEGEGTTFTVRLPLAKGS